MATASHTVSVLGANGNDITAGAEFESITSGAGNGRTFDMGAAPYFLIENTTASAISLTIKAGQPGDVAAAGVNVADKITSIPANSVKAFRANKILANNSGLVTLEAASAGLQVMAYR